MKYSTGFSVGALLLKESDAVYANILNPDEFVKGNEEPDYQSIPVNAETSKKRYGREVAKRIRAIGKKEFIRLYNHSEKADRLLILFYSACKTYTLISDFMLEVILDKWHNMDHQVDSEDFLNFIFRKTDQHPELENLSDKQQRKLASTPIRMMKEIEMIKNGKLQKPHCNPRILREIAENRDGWFLELLFLNAGERAEIMRL